MKFTHEIRLNLSMESHKGDPYAAAMTQPGLTFY